MAPDEEDDGEVVEVDGEEDEEGVADEWVGMADPLLPGLPWWAWYWLGGPRWWKGCCGEYG